MRSHFKLIIAIITASSLFTACKKTVDVNIQATADFGETNTALKDAADFPIGTEIGSFALTDPKYMEIAKRDFDIVTFGYLMKHAAIVQNDGSLNFANTDALVAAVGTQDIYGHTLGWHDNQNATYLKNFAGIIVPAAAELLANPGFEAGGATNFTNWSVFNSGSPAGSATITVGTGSEVNSGTRSMKVINPTPYPGNQFRVQVASDLMTVVTGNQYIVSYKVKAASAAGSIRLSTQYGAGGGSAQFQGDQTIGTAFQTITWNITANGPQLRILFDMGQVANTYYIDDASVKAVITPPTGTQVAAKLDTALGNFITGIVTRYKTKVKAWDVINELFADNGTLRNNANSPAPLVNGSPKPDWFVWSEYLGRDYALKAFNYAKAADPAADLYINEYNLESGSVKLDSLIAYVTELKGRGAKVDGIGTQMHISRTTSYAGIDAMMQKLAATGLKIRISELDVKAVLSNASGQLTSELAAYQAVMFKYVVQSYIKYIPKAQQAGITIWGINDKNSWLYNGGAERPLLYDDNYNKKPAYGAVLQALKVH